MNTSIKLVMVLLALVLAACSGAPVEEAPPPDIGVDLRCSPTSAMEEECTENRGIGKDDFVPYSRCLRDECDYQQILKSCDAETDEPVTLSSDEAECVTLKYTKVSALRNCEDRHEVELSSFPPPTAEESATVRECYDEAIAAQNGTLPSE